MRVEGACVEGACGNETATVFLFHNEHDGKLFSAKETLQGKRVSTVITREGGRRD